MSRIHNALRQAAGDRRPDDAVVHDSERPIDAVADEEGECVDRAPHFRVLSVHVNPKSAALTFDAPPNRVSEEYRIIRTRILHEKGNVRNVLISSPGPGDGKTTTAFNLATTLSLKSESKILLIEADLRRPSLSALIDLPSAPGLSNVLNGDCRLAEAIVRIEQCPNLCILPAGDASTHPAELLDSPKLRELLEECRGFFSTCILDGPPVASVADYNLLQNVVEAVVVVGRQDHTTRVGLKNALLSIPKEKLMGIVLNCVADWFLWKDPSYAYYTGYKSKQ
jgi:protein-tyrosine kinase